jgi:lipopolysaccharide transport system ATP-binding protein
MYRLAHQGKRTNSFRDAITSTVLAPFRRLRQLRGSDETMEEYWALKNVSFDVQPGEVVGIIGRNGAGKSTLLKILSRIVEPTEGEIRLRGRVASLLEVGTGFHPELTGRENIYLNGSILGMKKREIDRKFDEIVDFAEVEKFLDTPVKRYSSGMYVRLAFAVAAHLDPEILIVDEVLAVGDVEFQKKCLGKMKEVSTGTGRTVLFVSHNMGAIRSLCSRGIVLNSGNVFIDDTTDIASNKYMEVTSRGSSVTSVRFQKPNNASYWVSEMQSLVDGVPSCLLPMGRELTFQLELACATSIRNPKIMFLLSSEEGQRILQFSNRFCLNSLIEESEEVGKVRVQTAPLSLCAGKYAITLVVGDVGSMQQVVADALWITVDPRDISGSGRIPLKQDGLIWIPAAFKYTTDLHAAERTKAANVTVDIAQSHRFRDADHS